jgi:hypothetical protein
MMKEYKVDLSGYKGKVRETLSVAIQRHAFELGYEWESLGKEAFFIKSPYLFFDENGRITHLRDEDETFFENHSGAEISADDFLSLNQEPDFNPFDRVLVRDFDDEEWSLDLFKEIDKDKPYRYQCLVSFYHQCIPFVGNEHLLGTTGSKE